MAHKHAPYSAHFCQANPCIADELNFHQEAKETIRWGIIGQLHGIGAADLLKMSEELAMPESCWFLPNCVVC